MLLAQSLQGMENDGIPGESCFLPPQTHPIGAAFSFSSMGSSPSSLLAPLLTPDDLAFFDLARKGDVKSVLARLPFAVPGAVDRSGRTALMHAAIGGCAECVEILLDAPGADVARRDGSGSTALSLACGINHLAAALVLLRKGNADPRQMDRFDNPPLILAIRSRFFDLAHALLDFGADPRARDLRKQTALMWAAGGGDLDILRRLLPLSDANASDAGGLTALMSLCAADASRQRRDQAAQCVELLAPVSNVLALDNHGRHALRIAVDRLNFCCADALAPFMPVEIAQAAFDSLGDEAPRQMPRWAARLEAKQLGEAAGVSSLGAGANGSTATPSAAAPGSRAAPARL